MSNKNTCFVLAALCALAALPGCSKSPTGVSLHDAVAKTMFATDGNWSGLTDQGESISFSVSNKGARVNSGLKIRLDVPEYTMYVIYTTTVWMDVFDRSFQLPGSSSPLTGRFTSPERCSGTYHFIDNSYATPFDHAGTWNASWVSK
jgi:hypothetical protein